MRNTVGSRLKAGLFLSIITLLPFSAFGQAGLTLGGKFVPRDSIYLYLFLGNSVMSGRDTPPDTITDSHAWKYVMTNNCYNYLKPCPPQYSWQQAVDPICFDSKNPDGTLVKCSPGMPFLKRMVKDYPGYHFGVAQLSGSAWQLTHYQPPNSGDIKAFVTQGNALKANVHIAGIMMMFNIVEIQYSNCDSNYASIQNYAKNIDSVTKYLRTGLGLPDLPLVQTDFPVLGGKDKTSDYNLFGPCSLAIRALMNQNKLATKKTPTMVLIPTDSMTMYGGDGLFTHWSKKGYSIWANRVADSICARGWGPVNKCGVTGLAASVKRAGMTPYSSAMQKVLFDGHNWSVFEKAGKSFEMFLPNGKVVYGMTSTRLKNGMLKPGVYITRAIVEK
jgi:hypothetical protein